MEENRSPRKQVMIMNDALTRKAAKEFAEYWKDKGYEKGESQKFWLSLLRDICGVRTRTMTAL